MPALIRILTPTGIALPNYAATSLAEAAVYEPRDGVYTVANTLEATKTLKLDAHLDRLENSARLAGIALKLDRARLRAVLRGMITESGFGNVRYRITVPQSAPDRIILTIEPFKGQPESIYRDGMRLITSAGSARHDPAAKTTDWMHDRKALEESLPPGIYSALLLSESGDILEGTGSNFYAILNGELRTAGSGVLPGIAQQIVLEVAPRILPVRLDPVNVRDIPSLQEAFISSSTRGIVPAVEIDGVTLGSGAPGEKTRALRAAYQAWVAEHLEEL